MTTSDRKQLIANIFEEASQIFNFNRLQTTTEIKEDGIEIVSDLDLEVDHFMEKEIKKRFPEEDYVSEENYPKSLPAKFWIADPLDGTHNFLNGSVNYGICLAYCQEKQIKTAGIYLPAMKEIWLAVDGEGVVFNNRSHRHPTSSGKYFVFTDSNFRKTTLPNDQILKKLSQQGFSARLSGCCAMDFTLLAKSGGILIIDQPNLWDVAAGVLIAQELGYHVSDISQQPWRFHSRSLVITSLPEKERTLSWKIIQETV